MSKKLVNQDDHAVDECLAGLVAAHPGLSLLQGHRVIVRSDISSLLQQNKVTLLSGGGSGHEPAHCGFVGHGMLSAAVAGSVFASPPPASILAALRAISTPAGTLLIVKNYTGDRLNFGIAAERAKVEGVKVVMVVVGEDTALPCTGKSAGRRGLCGTVLVHKVAGALAEKGCSLEEVASAAQRVADSIATMSVSLSPCSVPGRGEYSFHLAADEIGFGIGIHGEAGAQKRKLQTADEVVSQMLSHLVSQDPGYQYFTAEPGMEVVLVVNSLGGTPNLELGIVANAAIKYLTDRLELRVVRVYMGALMTSLEMAGVSLTLLRVQADWLKCLDLATTAPGWPNVSIGVDGTPARVVSPPLPCLQQLSKRSLTEVKTAAGRVLRASVEAVCHDLQASAEELNQLDMGSGDGDCGSTLKAGADAIVQESGAVPWDDAKQSLLVLAECVERSMGGTSGGLYTLLLTTGAAEIGHSPGPTDWLRALQAGMEAITRYGGAAPGDRTMLDALNPAVLILSSGLQEGSDRQQCIQTLEQAVKAAEEGAADTARMEARAGRAALVDPTEVKDRDPGAHAVAIWMSAILKALRQSS